jgi:hypothetical protein
LLALILSMTRLLAQAQTATADSPPVRLRGGVTFKPGDTPLIVPGARVFVVAVQRSGAPTAIRLVVGRDGFAPAM